MRLGIRTVHWTARDGTMRHLVRQLNAALGAEDDFVQTPYVMPEVLENDRARVGGHYQDQASSPDSIRGR